MGIVGDSLFLNKIETESKFVNGIEVNSIFTKNIDNLSDDIKRLPYIISENYDEFLNNVDAVYIRSKPEFHYKHIKDAILAKKSVLCESPMTLKIDEWEELNSLANENKVVLMNSIKTAYSTAYSRLLLLLKGGKIGKIMSVDSNCTRLEDVFDFDYYNKNWNNIYEWGPTALLPIFQILGTNYKSKNMIAHYIDKENKFDDFVKIDFIYDNAVASMKIGSGVKTEGYLVISGTKGYAYVPAPWWKTDYFELRYEKIEENKRYFYQLDGEGIRYALVAFVKSIESGRVLSKITPDVSKGIIKCMEEFSDSRNVIKI
ncbi:Gfo/Idh/MocA family oxidoreductase [Helcococcus ovis]|nr:Gfo/Idh/MocA family oxidoreductase [Helcococcus ovis]WNZ02045.1 Gfo/Idh/MocA family oxidoreductase [Helcococcus ovis]